MLRLRPAFMLLALLAPWLGGGGGSATSATTTDGGSSSSTRSSNPNGDGATSAFASGTPASGENGSVGGVPHPDFGGYTE